MKDKDLLVLSHLRKNARMPLTKMSRATNIPVSTIFDKLREFEHSVIQKHTTLMDFKKLGYDLRVNLLFKVPRTCREAFQLFLLKSPKVNSVFRINNGYDYLVEGVFRNMKDLYEFSEQIDQYKIEAKQDFFILEDIKREEFLSYSPSPFGDQDV
jgi:DNA-binding Lrp family transcriptional regulator